MVYLLTNTAAQTLRLTLNEGRQFVNAYTHYLIHIKAKSTNIDYYLVANVAGENARVTTITISTASNAPTSSAVHIVASGEYLYYVYGQNSSSNLDPSNAVVQGLVERGQMIIKSATDFYEETSEPIPDGEEAIS